MVEDLIYNTFAIKNRHKCPDDCGIITATDSNMFPGFQLLYLSLSLSHNVNILVYDLGLKKKQLKWCTKLGIKPIKPPSLIVNNEEYMWQTWNKPIYIINSPFKKTLWIDADCVVVDNINVLFDLINTDIVSMKDTFLPNIDLYNNQEVYNYLSVNNNNDVNNINLPNAGVLGFKKDRDEKFLSKWIDNITNIFKNEKIKNQVKYYDQGVFIITLEQLNKLNTVIDNNKFNYGIKAQKMYKSPYDLLNVIKNNKKGNNINIIHFAGSIKPWTKWTKLILPIMTVDKMKIYILGHQNSQFEDVPKRPYLENINLSNLEIDKYQVNQIAESRIFLTDLNITTKFVGFGPFRWNDKFINSIKVEDLHLLLRNLNKQAVYTPSMVVTNWIEETEKWHPGMMKYVKELCDTFNLTLNANKPCFWSNTFICHIDVYKDFIFNWRKMFQYLYDKYKFNFDYKSYDMSRNASFLYERMTMLYFSNRIDLNIIPLNYTMIPNRLNKIFM